MSDPRELLNAYLDEELASDERAEVEAALSGSVELRRDLAELRATRGVLRDLGPVNPRRPLVQPDRAPAGVPARMPKRRFAAAVAGVAAVWLVVLSVGIGIGSLPVVPDVDQLALQHASATSNVLEFQEMSFEQMEDDVAILDDLGHGMVREAIFQSDELVQVRYSDGLHAISIFHMPGEVAWDDMPASGEVDMVDQSPVWTTTMEELDVLVVERGGLVVIVVADGDMDQEMTMTASAMVPDVDPDESLWGRIKDAPGNLIDRF